MFFHLNFYLEPMMNLFYEGGPLFMSLLSISFLIGAYMLFQAQRKNDWMCLSRAKSIALFSLILGILGQLIGLYSAFEALQVMGNISPQMMYGGLRVSMITTIYGALIFVILQAWSIVASVLMNKD